MPLLRTHITSTFIIEPEKVLSKKERFSFGLKEIIKDILVFLTQLYLHFKCSLGLLSHPIGLYFV